MKSISVIILILLAGCAFFDQEISYRKMCIHSALGAMVAAHTELGLSKSDIRVVLGQRGVRFHVWAEIHKDGKWLKVSDYGKSYITDKTVSLGYSPVKYYTYQEYIERVKLY